MLDPILIPTPELLKMLSIGKSKLFEMIATEEFAPQKVRAFGKKSLWRVDEVKLWVSLGCPNREKFQALQKEGKR